MVSQPTSQEWPRSVVSRASPKPNILETALEKHFASPRFRAFLVVHEYEGFAFSDPTITARVLLDPAKATLLQAERNRFASAEDVNDGQTTNPARRILRHFPAYKKTVFGPVIVNAIGLAKLRAECAHFNEWLGRLETV